MGVVTRLEAWDQKYLHNYLVKQNPEGQVDLDRFPYEATPEDPIQDFTGIREPIIHENTVYLDRQDMIRMASIISPNVAREDYMETPKNKVDKTFKRMESKSMKPNMDTYTPTVAQQRREMLSMNLGNSNPRPME